MDGGIITLPLRAGVGWTRLVLRAGVDLAGCAVRLGGKVAAAATDALGRTDAAGRTGDAAAPEQQPAPASAPDLTPLADLAHPAAQAPPPPVFDAPPLRGLDEPAEPAHVSAEPELVSEVAEPGAEDGAGASVAIAEPWPGYDRMQAKQVISRLAGATSAELAAVELYESSKRDRQTVRAAAQRSLKTKTGRGSPD
jgi:hypothetical protein